MILILTNKGDIHPNPVIEKLTEKGVKVFRFNTECLLSDYIVSWECKNNKTDFILKNKITQAEIKGSEIKSVWERRPEKPNQSDIENEQIKKICLDEAKGFLIALQYYLKDKFWIGNAIYDSVASSKLLQLKTAIDIGMKVPDTIHTNNKQQLDDFLNSQNQVVIKSLETQSFDIDEQNHIVFWTRKHYKTEILNYPENAVNSTVNFIQEYIEKKFELRITVVCDKVFACKIESQHLEDDKGKTDFRQGYEGIKYSAYELPKNVSNSCIEYLKLMNLNFGCFDFIVSPNDEYIFLECNPNGQWLWIEQETGLKIADTIANYLIKGNS
ncbi:MAG: hypothetical protein A2033_19760 [Bacteroidetes bacterium GWA2_31_9]|nr:MAG: hypothetical protein A2033_19760 [Bacteroidetes bacterium GWA2_31_9]